MNRRHLIPPALLLILGLAQMTGAALNIAPLKGLAAGTAASPAPKVFSSVKGLETFSTVFELRWQNTQGQHLRKQLTFEVYPRLKGPYNRRNIWGAMLAYGPVLASEPLTQPMFKDIITYGLCGHAPVLRELGIDPATAQQVSIHYTPRPGTHPALPMIIPARCTP